MNRSHTIGIIERSLNFLNNLFGIIEIIQFLQIDLSGEDFA